MDLSILRKNNFTKKCLQIFDNYPYIDQVIVNLYLKGGHEDLPAQYNIFNSQDDHLIQNHKDYILHYVGPAKPWNKSSPNQSIWKEYETYLD